MNARQKWNWKFSFDSLLLHPISADVALSLHLTARSGERRDWLKSRLLLISHRKTKAGADTLH